MTRKQAKNLKLGSRIEFIRGNCVICYGTLIEKDGYSVTIEWDDGQIGVLDTESLDEVFPVQVAQAA